MSAAQRVTSPNFGPAATTRVSSARNVASISFPRIDELSGSSPAGPGDQSVQYDESFQQSEHHQQREPQRRHGFSDFTSYAAVSYIDEVIASDGWTENMSPMVFQSEIMRGVGQYETNMRVISGVDHVSGETYNRVF